MGTVYRIYQCTNGQCRKQYQRKQPKVCQRCGEKEFSASNPIVDCWVEGKRLRKAIKNASMAEARAVLRKVEGQAVSGEYGLMQGKRTKLKDFIEDSYWSWYKVKDSARNVRYELDGHIIPEFGDKLLQRIGTKEIEGWRTRLLDQGLKPSTVNRLVSRMSSIFTRAVRWKEIAAHPIKGNIEQYEENNERIYYLTPEQYGKLMKLVEETEWPAVTKVNMKAAITLSIQTGLRKGNLFRLEWGRHVDMKNGLIYIPGTESKNNEPIAIPISDQVAGTLNALPKPLHSSFVFTDMHGGQFSRFMKNYWQELRDKFAEQEKDFPADFHWHDLRATCATWMKMAGAPDDVIMRKLNLKSARVLKRYRHHTLDQLKTWEEKTAEYFTTDQRVTKQDKKSS